ncbi:MAG TPA: Plug domain-containing protein, partial [Vicinamibacteria bacterium]|nr:Plug domain-containing protein [Vicinamibacteria bacterium]
MARTGGALVLALLLPAPAFPQAATATLEISIEGDDSPGRTVRLRGSGTEREQVTTARRRAIFFNLRPGLYRVSAGLPLCTADREVRVEAGQDVLAAVSCADGERAPELAHRRSLDRATSVSAEDLRTVPRPSDPWSVLRDVPGILTDRLNVGGSDTAQQSLILSRGDPGPGAVWTLDGVDITDPAALGFTSFYPDMDALAEMQVRTGAVDVRVRTPGAQVGLFLREPGEAFAGAVHLRSTGDALQPDNTPPDLRARNFLQTRTDQVLELGAEAGGPLREGRLWLWGAASWTSLRQQTFTEHAETLRVGSISAKARLRLGGGTLTLLGLRSEKTDEDRDTGFDAAPAARWRQSGPATLVALEDQRSLGELSLVARASYMAAGIRLDPQGGTAANAYEDLQGVAQGSYYTLRTDRPRFQAGI